MCMHPCTFMLQNGDSSSHSVENNLKDDTLVYLQTVANVFVAYDKGERQHMTSDSIFCVACVLGLLKKESFIAKPREKVVNRIGLIAVRNQSIMPAKLLE